MQHVKFVLGVKENCLKYFMEDLKSGFICFHMLL